MRTLFLLLISALLAGCGERTDLAPVEELKWQPHINSQGIHIVRPGETLYAVAFRYDTDFRQLAAYNRLRSPYALRVGQVLRIRKSVYTQRSKPHPYRQTTPAVKRWQPAPDRKKYTMPAKRGWFSTPRRYGGAWQWPAQGRIVTGFVPQQGKKGIDIAGKKGDLVRASANGVVAYAGSGLSGYGNLIIIKHDGQFLTAYGNNLHNRVKEGQRVKAGQIIADMGIIDRKFFGVHFEIRRSGQPVNPMSYLRRG
ncbi:hypothetical protein Lrub_1313 [Legionella rubrilucens]|uniref:LysM domain-containing protein n=1 Tax=Legionella rubrilucens TaxID=458 RepID=A0A0W0XWZ4_9GAMM|nr:peptidoglycan DD-metalloendopeptidase family protein [Legionella rubrilucens]KTD48962.1 hypothetical protein Lrub_1313 [Legionella rubrilucens]